MDEVEYIQLEERFGAHNYHPLPVVLSHGKGVWVWDVEGKKYLDCLSSYSAVNQGHCHPRIVRALRQQAGRLTLTSRAFYNDQTGLFLQELAHLCGKDMALPMNSGAEAVETGIKVARKWGYVIKGIEPEKAEIITCAGNFHGRTTTIIGFSTEAQYRFAFGPFTPGFVTVSYNDIEALRDAINKNTVAILIEPIQGEGGIIVPSPGYVSAIRALCSQHNILFLADEIQTGLGRTGALFCCDHENVIPDIYILGKALSGGMYPVSAVVANNDILGVIKPGDHGSTFGGNPLASAVAREALHVIVEEELPQKAACAGEYLIQELSSIHSPFIKEIRGRGLLIGIELNETAGPARPFCERLKTEGVLCKETHGTTIRFAPPLIISKREIDWALERIRKVLRA